MHGEVRKAYIPGARAKGGNEPQQGRCAVRWQSSTKPLRTKSLPAHAPSHQRIRHPSLAGLNTIRCNSVGLRRSIPEECPRNPGLDPTQAPFDRAQRLYYPDPAVPRTLFRLSAPMQPVSPGAHRTTGPGPPRNAHPGAAARSFRVLESGRFSMNSNSRGPGSASSTGPQNAGRPRL